MLNKGVSTKKSTPKSLHYCAHSRFARDTLQVHLSVDTCLCILYACFVKVKDPTVIAQRHTFAKNVEFDIVFAERLQW